jgi:hypothetical protein
VKKAASESAVSGILISFGVCEFLWIVLWMVSALQLYDPPSKESYRVLSTSLFINSEEKRPEVFNLLDEKKAFILDGFLVISVTQRPNLSNTNFLNYH